MSGSDEPESLREEMSIEELIPVARKLCVGTKGYPETGGDGAIIKDVTNELAWNARAALYTLYDMSRSSIRWVKESAQLDQEEALALVLAHLRGYALLPEELRKVGEQARLAAVAFKGKPPGAKGKPPKVPSADQQLKDNASHDKSKAKKDAAKDATLAAGLAQKLEDIDAVLATNRRHPPARTRPCLPAVATTRHCDRHARRAEAQAPRQRAGAPAEGGSGGGRTRQGC